MTMLKTFGLIAILAVAAVLLYATTRPDTFSIERTVLVHAPAERLVPLIQDLRQFSRWNPFEKKDPAIKRQYGGPAAGEGATLDFEGNDQTGQGRVSVVRVVPPQEVHMTLDMVKPMVCHNAIVFRLQTVPQGTQVTWAMSGAVPYLGKLVHLFFSMERMVGGEFEAGLADLKALAEHP